MRYQSEYGIFSQLRCHGFKFNFHFQEHNHQNENNTEGTATSTSPPPPIPRIADDELMRLIDGIMKDEDKDENGYITYQEFLRAVKGN